MQFELKYCVILTTSNLSFQENFYFAEDSRSSHEPDRQKLIEKYQLLKYKKNLFAKKNQQNLLFSPLYRFC